MKALTLFLFFLVSLPCYGTGEYPRISVGGSSVVLKPADKLNMTIGVVTQNEDVKVAMGTNGEKMTPIVEILKKIGLSEKEYQTGTYTISPIYTPQPKSPPPDWHPEISGYEVRNTIRIQTKKLDLASTIVDSVGKRGVNLIENISFILDNEEAAKGEAIGEAVLKARSYAQSAASAARVTLGRIREITIHPATFAPRMQKVYAVSEATTPIAPGDVEVRSDVQMVFEIL